MVILSSITGLFAGFIHALTGPDHIAAIAPLAIDSRGRRWLAGFRWGLGHAGGALIVGFAALYLREILPMESISSFSERLVGFSLIAIGLWGVHKAFTTKLHEHAHVHEDSAHNHIHIHHPEGVHDKPAAHAHTHAALAVGLLHGLAGGSYILAVVPALALPSTSTAVCYLIFFGVGTIAAMTGFSSAVGMAADRLPIAAFGYKRLMGGCSVLAIIVGTVWLVL